MINWIKRAQSYSAKLEKGVHTQSQRVIYFLTGNTYPLHQTVNLKNLGFQWWSAKKMWWMYSESMTNQTIDTLSKQNVDISSVQQNSDVPPISRTENYEKNRVDEVKTDRVIDNLTDKSTDMADVSWPDKTLSSKAGFPIKTIYQTDVEIQYQGRPVIISVTVKRKAKEGVSGRGESVAKGWKNYPRYLLEFRLKGKEELIGSTYADVNKDENSIRKMWSQINETEEIVNKIGPLVKTVFENPLTKAHKLLQVHLNLDSRDPELVEFLKNYSSLQSNAEKITKTLHINHPQYKGEYPVLFKTYNGVNWYVDTKLEHKLASHPVMLISFTLPSKVQTMDEFNQWIDAQMSNPDNISAMEERYVEYLQSFPFLQTEQEEAEKEFIEVNNVVKNRLTDTTFFRNKLLQLGYIRPTKKTKNLGSGMVPQDSVVMILDTKKIINDIYSFGKSSSSPNFIYAAISYYMHRLKSGNIGFHPIQIIDSLRMVCDTLSKFGTKITISELEPYIESLAKQLLRDLFGLNSRTAWDSWQEFYSGNYGTSNEPASTSVSSNSIEEFAQFATIHGIDYETSKKTPYAVYKQLAKKLHPDSNPNDPEQSEQEFKQLGNLWNKIPAEFKTAYVQWMRKVLYS